MRGWLRKRPRRMQRPRLLLLLPLLKLLPRPPLLLRQNRQCMPLPRPQ